MQLETFYLDITLLMSNLLKHAKLSKCNIEISEDPMFIDHKLGMMHPTYINS